MLTTSKAEIAAVRNKLLDDYAPIKTVAEAAERSVRTVLRWDLPSIKIGSLRLIHIPSMRERMAKQLRGPDLPPPRERGRPRKATATTRK